MTVETTAVQTAAAPSSAGSSAGSPMSSVAKSPWASSLRLGLLPIGVSAPSVTPRTCSYCSRADFLHLGRNLQPVSRDRDRRLWREIRHSKCWPVLHREGHRRLGRAVSQRHQELQQQLALGLRHRRDHEPEGRHAGAFHCWHISIPFAPESPPSLSPPSLEPSRRSLIFYVVGRGGISGLSGSITKRSGASHG